MLSSEDVQDSDDRVKHEIREILLDSYSAEPAMCASGKDVFRSDKR
jgi:hypothetical protein